MCGWEGCGIAVRWSNLHPAAFFFARHMYLLYLDDSGSANNRNEHYLVLGGVAVFERQVHWLSKALDDLAARIQPSDPSSVEFHASEIFSGRQPPWDGMSKPERQKTIKDVLDVVNTAHSSTVLFACAVHKDSYPSSDPMELAFEELCSRFDLLLRRLHSSGDTQRGLIILDESSYETTLQDLAKHFRSLGTRWNTRLVNLVDVPLFVDSQASRVVQLADHVAYAAFRRYESGDTNYLDPIVNRFDCESGRMHGLVHKQTTIAACPCPACLTRRNLP